MSVVKQIIRNTLSGWLAVGIRGILALIMVPFLLSHLGKEGFGLIGILSVIVSMAVVADLGLRSALGRELAEQVARNDLRIFNELASTALVLYFFLACILGFTGWLLAPWIVDFLKVSEALREDAVNSIRIYGTVSVILSFITPVFSAALSSFHRFDIINSVQLIVGIISSIVLFVVIPNVENPLYGLGRGHAGVRGIHFIADDSFFSKILSRRRDSFWFSECSTPDSIVSFGGVFVHHTTRPNSY